MSIITRGICGGGNNVQTINSVEYAPSFSNIFLKKGYEVLSKNKPIPITDGCSIDSNNIVTKDGLFRIFDYEYTILNNGKIVECKTNRSVIDLNLNDMYQLYAKVSGTYGENNGTIFIIDIIDNEMYVIHTKKGITKINLNSKEITIIDKGDANYSIFRIFKINKTTHEIYLQDQSYFIKINYISGTRTSFSNKSVSVILSYTSYCYMEDSDKVYAYECNTSAGDSGGSISNSYKMYIFNLESMTYTLVGSYLDSLNDNYELVNLTSRYMSETTTGISNLVAASIIGCCGRFIYLSEQWHSASGGSFNYIFAINITIYDTYTNKFVKTYNIPFANFDYDTYQPSFYFIDNEYNLFLFGIRRTYLFVNDNDTRYGYDIISSNLENKPHVSRITNENTINKISQYISRYISSDNFDGTLRQYNTYLDNNSNIMYHIYHSYKDSSYYYINLAKYILGIKMYAKAGWKVNGISITTTGLQDIQTNYPINIETN